MASAFKTAGLRTVALRAPYMHAGQIASLTGLVRHYARTPQPMVGYSELKPVRLSESAVQALVALLGTLLAIDEHKAASN